MELSTFTLAELLLFVDITGSPPHSPTGGGGGGMFGGPGGISSRRGTYASVVSTYNYLQAGIVENALMFLFLPCVWP